MFEINWLAILVSVLASMALGGIWYGPLFGKVWMRGLGIDPKNTEQVNKMKKGAGLAYAQQFLGSLLAVYVLAHILWAFGVALPDTTGWQAGVMGGFWCWLGFVLPVKYGDKLWGGKSLKFVSVDLSYYLVNLVVAGIILSVWK